MKRFKFLTILFLCFSLSAEAQLDPETVLEQMKAQNVSVSEVFDLAKKNGYTIDDLKSAGYTVKDFTDAGVTIDDLKEAGVTVDELKAAGVTVDELKNAGFTVEEFLNSGYTVTDLKAAGFSATDLIVNGVPAGDLKNAGFTLSELKTAGVAASELKNIGFSLQEMKNAGFTAGDLLAGGFSATELKSVGYTIADFKASGTTATTLKLAGFSALELKGAGYTVNELKLAGFSVQDLSNSGFSDNQLKLAGFSASDFKSSGYNAAALMSLGFQTSELKLGGYSANELKEAGLSASGLKAAGFSLNEILAANAPASELKAAGYSASDLKAAGKDLSYIKGAGYTQAELMAAGFSQADIINAGDSVAELLANGATINELLQGNKFSIKDMLDAGVAVNDLKGAGVSAADLMNSGASLSELKNAGYTIDQFVAAGASSADLLNAGFNVNEISSAGVSTGDLINSGVSTKKLIDSGISLQSLMASGVSLTELKEAGASVSELSSAGAKTSDLKAAGFSESDLFKNGSSIGSLLASGSSVQDLVNSGISTKDLKSAGITDVALKNAGVSASELKSNGTTSKELKDLGFSIDDIKTAGVSDIELKSLGFSATEVRSTGSTTANLISAGFTPSELLGAGISEKELLSEGITVKQLSSAGVSASSLASAGATKQELLDAGLSAQEAEAALAGGSAGSTENSTDENATNGSLTSSGSGGATGSGDSNQKSGGVTGLVRSIASAEAEKTLDDGPSCVSSTGNNTDAIACRDSGKVWSCKLNVCYSEEYRSSLVDKGAECIVDNSKEEANICLDNLERDAASHIASGAECNKSSQEAIDCAAQGKIFNCNVNLCLDPSQNASLTTQVTGCITKETTAETDLCLEDLNKNFVKEIANSCDITSNTKAQQCNNTPGKVWNCVANYCLTKDYNEGLVSKISKCNEGENSQGCLDDLKEDTVSDIVRGKMCDGNSAQAVSCKNDGKHFNCEFNYCMSEQQAQFVTGEALLCIDKTGAEQDQCMNGIKEKAISYEASGQLCDKNNSLYKQCSDKGQIWNCNIDHNTCLTKNENELLTRDIVSCYMSYSQQNHIDNCLKDVEVKATRYALTQRCEAAEGDLGAQCSAKGKEWNCMINECLSVNDNNRFMNAYFNCKSKKTAPAVEACMAELEEFGEKAEKMQGSDDGFITELERIQGEEAEGSRKYREGMDTISKIAGISAFGLCRSPSKNMAAAANGKQVEVTAHAMSQREFARIRAEYEALEAKKETEGVSYEIQLEGFRFYIKSLEAGAAIADFRAAGYAQTAAMFAAAMATAGGDIAIGAGLIAAGMALNASPCGCGGPLIALGTMWVACGAMNLMIGSAGKKGSLKAKAMAEDAAREMRRQIRELKIVLAQFERLFGNDAGMVSYQDMNDLGNKADLEDKDKIPFNVSGAGTTNLALAGSGTQGSGELSDVSFRSCTNADGEADLNCDCKKSNTCFSTDLDLSKQGDIGQSIRAATDIDTTIRESNDILSGNISPTELDQAALSKRIDKSLEKANELLGKARKKAPSFFKKEGIPNKIDDKYVDDQFNKYFPNGVDDNNYGAFSNGQDQLNGLLSGSKALDLINKNKTLAGDGDANRGPASSRNPSVINNKESDFAFNFGDDKYNTIGDDTDVAIADEDVELTDEDKFGVAGRGLASRGFKNMRGIITNPKLSIFKKITKRYHKVRMRKDIGN